jgi:hypothetical protein
MKTVFYLICTSFLSTGFYMVGLNSKNSVPGIATALCLWVIFFWGWDRRRKKTAAKRKREQLWEDFFRRHPNDNNF